MRKWFVLVVTLAAVASAAGYATVAYASSNKEVIGQGNGSITCTSGGPAFPATINFQADLNKGTVTGFFQIIGTVQKFGGVTSGSVSTKSYSLSGNETFAACPGSAFPTTYTIGKDCGTGVAIDFVAANGERGAFVGNVACST